MIYHISFPLKFEITCEQDRLTADEALEICRRSILYSIFQEREEVTISIKTSLSEVLIEEEYEF